jgi:hypothetical protein
VALARGSSGRGGGGGGGGGGSGASGRPAAAATRRGRAAAGATQPRTGTARGHAGRPDGPAAPPRVRTGSAGALTPASATEHFAIGVPNALLRCGAAALRRCEA